MPDSQSERREPYRYLALGQVGMEMVAPIVLGIFADRWLGWTPWLTILGAVVGFVGGMNHLLAVLNKAGSKEDTKNQDQGTP